MKQNVLTFRVSSGLKNLIGRDLISDKYIAIFELVKNSYDAYATKVDISFLKNGNFYNQIIISDNGSGMTYYDIVQKWLFVAYSEKKKIKRDRTLYSSMFKRELAGAKGVGRFSCDSLGSLLKLISKTKSDEFANEIIVNWDDFELDDSREFIDIPVKYNIEKKLPSDYQSGTTLIVENLREEWTRADLLRLKRSLMKLISPDSNNSLLPFSIELHVPSERDNDNNVLKKSEINPFRDTVNGIIYNDIFEKLNIKTTSIEVSISEDGMSIKTKLVDRGEYIFSVVEKNRDYAILHNISIIVYYLNQNAKASFTRQMGGVQPKNYGSVFIYKNGFRINPYGEPGQDFFGIDQRKAQGWKRYLGTREIMGRISIKGDNNLFIETTSRAHGFIQNSAVEALSNFFVEKVLRPLEKYVVTLINWGEPLKADPEHTILPNEIGQEIISQFIPNTNVNDVISFDYNSDILPKKNDEDDISSSIKKLDMVAENAQDQELANLAKTLKQRTESIIMHNISLEEENEKNEKALISAKKENQAREKQIFFLKQIASKSISVSNFLNGFHSIYTLTDASRGYINLLISKLLSISFDERESLFLMVEKINQANEKANKIADLAIHGNQALKNINKASLYDFIQQYVERFEIEGLKCKIEPSHFSSICNFDPASIGIIIDNLGSNSVKAGATIISISFCENKKYVEVSFTDNGVGLPNNVDTDSLFELGFSMNRINKGFGIGLYQVKNLMTEMKGIVEIDTKYKKGFKIILRFQK